jgi:ribosomal protein S18 acetylase RimI-like enzyme
MLIRPVRLRDLNSLESVEPEDTQWVRKVREVRSWFGLVKLLNLVPNRFQHLFDVHVAQVDGVVVGLIQVSPTNEIQSTWRIEHFTLSDPLQSQGLGTLLLAYIFEYYRSAKTWIVEADIHNKEQIAIYRQNGFQSMAEITYWRLPSAVLENLAKVAIQSLNLRPVSNADAALLCQLDCATMPSMLRQVYDRHPDDFRRPLPDRIVFGINQSLHQEEQVFEYVYEPQRRAAIGAFDLKISKQGLEPHRLTLWIHPAYTWLYRELLVHISKILSHYPPQSLELFAGDYQAERQSILESLEGEITHTKLLMSRSVWHKVREFRNPLENLSLDMLPAWRPLTKPLMPEPVLDEFKKDAPDPQSSSPG